MGRRRNSAFKRRRPFHEARAKHPARMRARMATGEVGVSGPLSESSRLRVFMTGDAVGGVWQYALDLAEGLRPHGVGVTLAVLGPAPSADQQRMAEAAGIDLMLTGLPLDWVADTPEDVEEAGRVLACIATQVAPDIVHLNNPALAAHVAFPAPVVAVCHSCVATWWQAVRSGPLPEEFVWRTTLVREGYMSANVLLAPTAAFAQATAGYYDLGTPPIVVRNGRRAPSFQRRAAQDLFVFTAGRLWDDGKNVAALDRAAACLTIPVRAAGPVEGPNGAFVRMRNIEPLGKLSDEEIGRCLAAKPIFVSSARYEPFGLAVLEAAQAGCPLVLSDIPTFRELWDGAAVFVGPDDDEGLARAIHALAQDADARARLGKAAQAVAMTYSVEAMSAGVLKVYRSLLARNVEKSSVEEAAA